MDYNDLKSKILKACKRVQSQIIENLNIEISDAKRMSSDIICPVERDDGGYQAQLLAKIDMLGKQLRKATELYDVLLKVQPEKRMDTVGFGAVVITVSQKLFISAAIGKVEVNGDTYYAISPNVPVYKAMNGKRANDEFVFNGKRIKILEVY